MGAGVLRDINDGEMQMYQIYRLQKCPISLKLMAKKKTLEKFKTVYASTFLFLNKRMKLLEFV